MATPPRSIPPAGGTIFDKRLFISGDFSRHKKKTQLRFIMCWKWTTRENSWTGDKDTFLILYHFAASKVTSERRFPIPSTNEADPAPGAELRSPSAATRSSAETFGWFEPKLAAHRGSCWGKARWKCPNKCPMAFPWWKKMKKPLKMGFGSGIKIDNVITPIIIRRRKPSPNGA